MATSLLQVWCGHTRYITRYITKNKLNLKLYELHYMLAYVIDMTVFLTIFPVILQTDINVIMLSIGGQGKTVHKFVL